MIIEPARIPEEGTRLTGEESPGALELDAEEDIRPLGPVRYDCLARRVTRELLVTGTVQAEIGFRCSRCGEPFHTGVEDRAFHCEREVVNEYESVDLTPDVRESIILAFPSHPVCRPDCKGLCPRCGANLNRETCSCPPSEGWHLSGLDDLKL